MAESPTNTAPVAWLLRRRRRRSSRDLGPRSGGAARRTLRAAGCAQIESVDAAAPPPALRGRRAAAAHRLHLRRAAGARAAGRARHVARHAGRRRRRRARRRRARRRSRGWLAQGAAASAFGLRARDALRARLALHRGASQARAGLPVRGARRARAALERRTFAASYKGVTDLVTKWVWPRPAARRRVRLAARRVHPEHDDRRERLLAASPSALFARGAFGAGLFCAWLMTFLDTVDGKLARVTLTSSRVRQRAGPQPRPRSTRPSGTGPGATRCRPRHEWATAVVVVGYFGRARCSRAFLARFRIEIPLLASDRLAVPYDHGTSQSEPDPPQRGGARRPPRPRPRDGGALDAGLLQRSMRVRLSRPLRSGAAAA